MNKFNIRFHAKAMLSGLLKTLAGASTAGLIGMAIYGYISIPAEGGYVAVADFICSSCFLIMALVGMYGMGRGVNWGSRKEVMRKRK